MHKPRNKFFKLQSAVKNYLWYNCNPYNLLHKYTILPCVNRCRHSWVNIPGNSLCQNILSYKLSVKTTCLFHKRCNVLYSKTRQIQIKVDPVKISKCNWISKLILNGKLYLDVRLDQSLSKNHYSIFITLFNHL